MLLASTIKTPVGTLDLIADENVLLAAGFKGLDNLVTRLSNEDFVKGIKKGPENSNNFDPY